MARLFVLALALALAGCASTGSRTAGDRLDPWEKWNRKVFDFNETLDRNVLTPLATAYSTIVPQVVRQGIDNFLGNFSDMWSTVNSFLQGKGTDGFTGVIRVGTNTVFGLGGLLDFATELGIERHSEDFGQTLGRWGFESGPYMVLPVLGPSTVRDSLALPLDLSASPSLITKDTSSKVGIGIVRVINTRANLLGASRVVDDIALDKYTFVRDAYLQRRRSLVFDGDVPDDPGADRPRAPGDQE